MGKQSAQAKKVFSSPVVGKHRNSRYIINTLSCRQVVRREKIINERTFYHNTKISSIVV